MGTVGIAVDVTVAILFAAALTRSAQIALAVTGERLAAVPIVPIMLAVAGIAFFAGLATMRMAGRGSGPDPRIPRGDGA